MQLNELVFHYVDTKQHKKEVTIHYNQKTYDASNPLADKFAIELAKNFYKRSIQRARFDTSTHTTPEFEQLAKQYIDDEINFLEFSKDATVLLKKQMEKTPLSTGGIVVFGDIKTDTAKRFLFVAILNKSEKFAFDESSLDLKEVEILENEKLAVAAFLNIEEYLNAQSQKHYISFLRGLREIANYFTDFLGIGEDRVEATKQTTELVKAIRSYIKSLDKEEDEKNQMFYRIYNTLYGYADQRQDVTIEAVSALIDAANPEAFKEYIQSPDSEFHINSVIELLDKNKLKRLKSFKFQTTGFSLSFDRDKYDFAVENGRIILKNPPSKLIEELKEEFEDE